jgi:peroxiredoxin (alkyl hydroperoxide reductase subunit C)
LESPILIDVARMTLTEQRVLAVGEHAPDFTLPSTSDEAITLSAFRGRKNVLLAFFPLAFSGTCTKELCAFRDDFERFETAETVVIPISVDSTYSLKEFKAKHQIPLEMASDFKRDVSVRYGVLHPERFYARRSYFLIDREGVIRWVHVETVPGAHRPDAVSGESRWEDS